jgi:hypothetical protein
MPIQNQPRTTWPDQERGLGASLRDEGEPKLHQSQGPPGRLRLQVLRGQGLQEFLARRRHRLSSAANI